MKLLSANGLKVLQLLGTFKFLSTSQLLDLLHFSIDRPPPRNSLNRTIRGLKIGQKPLLESRNLGVVPGKGRLDALHHLTKHGAELLVKGYGMSADHLRYPKGKSTLFYYDYYHRLHTIDCHIGLYKYCTLSSHQLLFFHSYFDQIGSNRRNGSAQVLSKVVLQGNDFFIPDGLFMVENKVKERRLFALEMYNGRDTARVLRQWEQHARALSLGSVTLKYQRSHNFNRAHRVLSVFEHESAMMATIERASNTPVFTQFKPHFLCKSLEQVRQAPFNENWLDINNMQIEW